MDATSASSAPSSVDATAPASAWRRIGAAGWIGIAVVVFWALAALLGQALLSRTGAQGGGGVFAPISAAHWLGTDYLGRDMLARVIEGARYTVGVAFAASLLASATGTTDRKSVV